MVGPQEVGHERMLEKKRERHEGDCAFRERGDEGLDMDEKMLMGSGDSFKAQWILPCITLDHGLLTQSCAPFHYTGLLAEMLHMRGLNRSKRIRYQHRASGWLRYVKRTRRLWTCSCR